MNPRVVSPLYRTLGLAGWLIAGAGVAVSPCLAQTAPTPAATPNIAVNGTLPGMPLPPSPEEQITKQMGELAAKGDEAGFERLRESLEAKHTAEAYVALAELYRDLPTAYILHIRRYEIAAGYYQQAIAVAKDTKREGAVTNAARVSLARMILSGRLRNHDFVYALGLLKKAIETGDNSAPYVYARRLELGYGETPPDYKEAEYWYRYALRGQVGEAAFALASLYRRHHATPPTPTAEHETVMLGLTLLRARADVGDGGAAFRIAQLYATGNGLQQSPKEARAWYEKAAKLGSVPALRQLASLTSKEGDRSKATDFMRQAANAGSVSAAAELARSLTQPEDYYLEVDPKEAQTWLVRAAWVGHIGSITLYTQQLIAAGKGVQAVAFLEQAANHGSMESYFTLYQMFKTGNGVALDIARAKRYFAEALASGDTSTAEKTKLAGVMLTPGEPVFDVAGGIEILKACAASGNGDAMAALATFYMNGSVVPKNPPLSIEWRMKASNAGDLSSTLELARLYEQGVYLKRDPKKAYSLVSQVLLNVAPDDSKAMLSIGRIYVNGRVVAKDMEEAAKWYRRAITAGNPEALVALGRLAKWNALKGYKPDQAIAMFRQAAATGSRSALMELALCYVSGTLVPQDAHIALDYFRLAAQAGSSEAMRQIGMDYLGGFGVEPDPALAKKYLTQAVGAGNIFALVDLGNVYASEGDRGEAWKLWKRAADMNNPDALYLMAVATRTGVGQPKDLAASAHYLEAAAKLANYPAKRERRLAAAAAGLSVH